MFGFGNCDGILLDDFLEGARRGYAGKAALTPARLALRRRAWVYAEARLGLRRGAPGVTPRRAWGYAAQK